MLFPSAVFSLVVAVHSYRDIQWHSDFEVCGVSNFVNYRQPRGNSTSPRIVNGKPSRSGSWPWQVSLQVLHPKYGLISHWCGGVLIDPHWVLTAAHCIDNDIFNLPLPALWTAVLGDWDREVEEKTELRIQVEEILIHNAFKNYDNDIALMRLSKRVSMEKGVRSVCLGSRLDVEQLCTATGWGRATQAGPLSSTLRQIKVPLHSNKLCQEKYGPAVNIQEGHLCAGKLDGSTGACIGDSGGPLQCSKNGKWFLVGITSFGSGCAKPGFPDVYTRLSFYLPWIQEQITSNTVH
ncbi:plasma kallikrein-like isoform X2 [Cimex lectularius]|uniref:limulus clotting factor C n=1 Tax=Cimex lectularius TaxID=79782 RepID=A0A8I6RP11_CIMLE|nr:plasma kallikrein-like isoform X2 [Cimex lectularius]